MDSHEEMKVKLAATDWWTFLLLCLLVSASDAQINIRAEPGQIVILPCEVPRNTTVLVVEWIRPDLDAEHVFWCKNGQSDPDHQHPSFRNRVELKDGGMKDGNLSVILKNVTINDTGTYECHVGLNQSNHRMSMINLTVVNPGGEAGHISDGGNKSVGANSGRNKNGTDSDGGTRHGAVRLSVSATVIYLLVVFGVGSCFVMHRQSKTYSYKPSYEKAVGYWLTAASKVKRYIT
ncbi:myelin-oligodendrocyte glycoprotein-like [Channa argus]|uniref:myelin-oligodendrocyte glycoprotein-like n=1 Tax=Channa argus TaxID=215402 RepID=UPI00351F8C1E